MEFKELQKKTENELHKLLAELRDHLREMRFKDANKQLKDVKTIKKVRNEIAQILTIINGRRADEKKTINK